MDLLTIDFNIFIEGIENNNNNNNNNNNLNQLSVHSTN